LDNEESAGSFDQGRTAHPSSFLVALLTQDAGALIFHFFA